MRIENYLARIGAGSTLAGLVAGFCLLQPSTLGSEVTVDFVGGYVDQPMIVIRAGDRVKWTPPQPGDTGYVESYGGEFTSGALTNGGPGFSVTLTNAGFYAYRTSPTPGRWINSATIQVVPAGGSLGPVMVNSPLDGFFFNDNGNVGPIIPIQVSVADSLGPIQEVDVLTNGVMITALTQAPYRFMWNPPPGIGWVAISGRVVTRGGGIYTSPATSVGIDTGSFGILGPPHRLPSGQFVFYYSVGAPISQWQWRILFTDEVGPPLTGPPWALAISVFGYGVFVDEKAGSTSHRFYVIESGLY